MQSTGAVLQTAAAIAKTTQTLLGSVINCRGYNYVTLFYAYVKGDETGLTIIPWVIDSAGNVYRVPVWTASSGAYTQNVSYYAFTQTATGYITLDVTGVDQVKFTQGGTANDGTPTGTLAASYLAKGFA